MNYAGWIVAAALAIAVVAAQRLTHRRLDEERARQGREIAQAAENTSAELDAAEQGIRERERMLAEETATCNRLRAQRAELEARLRQAHPSAPADADPGETHEEAAGTVIPTPELQARIEAVRKRLALVRQAVRMVTEQEEL